MNKIIPFLGILIIFGLPVSSSSTEFTMTENDIEWCEEGYSFYEQLGLDWFLDNYDYSIESRICANLYEDPIWDYVGDDRMEKLLERSQHYVELEIEESEAEAKTGVDDPTPAKFPTWIKDVAGFWVEGLLDDDGFVQVIEWLVQNDIIRIPYAEPPEGDAAVSMPSWIKTNTSFWVENKLTDDEFAMGIEWLINNGIIRV